MRIIAGAYRGRLLQTLRGRSVRPTSDRLRETLFNVLGAAVADSVFVDGYAGSGAVGLEAWSRDARQVFLIERNAAARRILLGNLSALRAGEHGAGGNVEVIPASVQKGLRLLEQRGVEANFCFLDPPYDDRQESIRALEWLAAGRLMAPGGTMILEHRRSETLPQQVSGWAQKRTLIQGSSALSFYRSV